MAEQHELSAVKVKALTEPRRRGVGDGLDLVVSPLGSNSWVYMWKRAGRRREMGLGRFPDVSLAAARERAGSARKVVADGGDPIT